MYQAIGRHKFWAGKSDQYWRMVQNLLPQAEEAVGGGQGGEYEGRFGGSESRGERRGEGSGLMQGNSDLSMLFQCGYLSIIIERTSLKPFSSPQCLFHYNRLLLNMPKICEHLLNLKLQKIANLFNKCHLTCTGNKTHHNSFLDICLSCGQTRCLSYETIECSYQHSYGTKHPLVFRTDSNSLYCFSCQQNLTEALNSKEEMEVSNNKLEKIEDAHGKVLEMSVKVKERLAERPLVPQKKVEKEKKEKNVKEKEKEKVKEKEQIELHHPSKEQLQVFGLKNLGNTCFFNSTIQCLYSTQILHALYNTMTFDTDLDYGKVGEINLIFKKYLKNTEKHFTPKALFNWVCKAKGQYKHMDQQDAQQLLGVLLNGLIDGQKFWMGEEKRKEMLKNRKNTVTEKVFGFYLASRLECYDCEKISWSIDFSLQVAVSLAKTFNKKIALPEGEVPRTEIDEQGLVYPQFKESGSIIDTFFTPQYLGKQNYFTCQGCQSQKAVRKFYMKDPPCILILTLKRFNNNLSKNNTEVKASPLLDLSGHCLNPGPHHYQLYSMIVHNGTARGGHYTALSKRGDSWFFFSDSTFKQMGWEKVRSSQPYILFYRRTSQ